MADARSTRRETRSRSLPRCFPTTASTRTGSRSAWRAGDSYTKLDGDRVEIKIGFGYSGDGATTAWNVLHELAHAILFLRGNTSHRHGPEFERLLLELIGKYTRVRGVTPHQSSVTTWRSRPRIVWA